MEIGLALLFAFLFGCSVNWFREMRSDEVLNLRVDLKAEMVDNGKLNARNRELQDQLEHANHEIHEYEELEKWHRAKRDILKARVRFLRHELATEQARTKAAFAREWEQWGERDRLMQEYACEFDRAIDYGNKYVDAADERDEARREIEAMKASAGDLDASYRNDNAHLREHNKALEATNKQLQEQ